MIRRMGLILVLGAIVSMSGPEARAQWGCGGWGWSGWDTTQKSAAPGAPALYAMGAGIYNYDPRISADVTMRWNICAFEGVAHENLRRYRARAKAQADRIHEQTKKGVFIDPLLAQKPTKDQIENGDALNLAVAKLSDPRLGTLASRLAKVPVAASLIAEVPFESASDRVTFMLDELRAAVRWPRAFPNERFADAEKAFNDLVGRMRREDEAGDISAKTLQETREFLSDLRARLVAQPLKDANDQKDVMRFLDAASGLVRLLEKPDIRPAISALRKVKDTSLANLLGFLHAFNLRFGVATTPKEREAYHRLFAILDQARDEVLAEAKLGGPTAGEANPSHVMDFFHNQGQAPSQGPTPPPPAQPRSPQ